MADKTVSFKTFEAMSVENGSLIVQCDVPKTLGTIDAQSIADMILHMKVRIECEAKPASTYKQCLDRLEHHSEQLLIAYTKLIETYQRAITPAVRTSPIDKARAGMMEGMDDKMLRQFGAVHIGERASDFVLPDEREELIDSVVAAMKKAE